MFFMQALLGRGAAHTRKNKKKGVSGWEKKRQQQYLHPRKVMKRKYGMKENGNKTWALFPSSSFSLNSFNTFKKLNISLLILLQPVCLFHCMIPVLWTFISGFHPVSLSSVHLSYIPLSSGTYMTSITMDQFKYYFWLSDLYPPPSSFLVYHTLCLDYPHGALHAALSFYRLHKPEHT